MSVFGNKSTQLPPPPAPPRELLVRKLDSLRPAARWDDELRDVVVVRDDEVTGLLDLTFERLDAAQSASTEQLRAATERLLSPPPTRRPDGQ